MVGDKGQGEVRRLVWPLLRRFNGLAVSLVVVLGSDSSSKVVVGMLDVHSTVPRPRQRQRPSFELQIVAVSWSVISIQSDGIS